MWHGHFDAQGNACLDFAIPRLADQAPVSLPGIIDTGFDGFVQIPLSLAVALGLVTRPFMTGNTSLANGKIQQVFLKKVSAQVQGEAREGLCQLPPTPESPVLVGMGLLKRFDRMLIISSAKKKIFLPKESEVNWNPGN